jgi:hypothetical protein
MGISRRLERILETQELLTDLRLRVERWFEYRRAQDAVRQYWTQLGALEKVLCPSLARVQAELDAIQAGASTGWVHAECRRNDRRLHLLDRYWSYFSSKWDQRDDDAVKATLFAADEVVWSCWATPFSTAGEPIASAPLPYLEPFYSPRAIQRSSPPADVQRADPLLRSALKTLPLPLVGLPPVVHSRPWWLASLAHEIGHHIEHDLLGGALYTTLPATIESVVPEGEDPQRWRGWHEEIFADTWSVLLLGPAAAAATGELLRSSDALMLVEDDAYPSTAVRQSLMSNVLSAAKCPGTAIPTYRPDSLEGLELAGAEQALRATAQQRRLLAPRVASALVGLSPSGSGPLPNLAAWDERRYGEDGEVAYWRKQLLAAGADPLPETDPHTARTALAGGVAAWEAIAEIADDTRRSEERHHLEERMRRLLPLCRPEGKRAGRAVSAPDMSKAEEVLTDVLFGEAIQTEV